MSLPVEPYVRFFGCPMCGYQEHEARDGSFVCVDCGAVTTPEQAFQAIIRQVTADGSLGWPDTWELC